MTEERPAAAGAAPRDAALAQDAVRQKFLSWRTLASFAAAGALLALTWVLADLQLEDIAARIRSANPWLILAAYGVFGLTFPIRTLRWRALLLNTAHRENVDPQYRALDLFQILYISFFVNGVAPAKLGDIYRGYMARANYGTSLTRTLGTVVSERVLDVGTLIALVLGSAALLIRAPETSEDVGRVLVIAAAAMGVLALGVAFLLFFGTPIFARLPRRAAEVYERFHSGVFDSWTWRSGPLLLLASLAIWLLEMARLALVMQALGLSLSAEAVIFVGTASSLLLAVPTPGGLGAVEGGLLGLMRLMGVGFGAAGTVAIVDRVITYWSVVFTSGLLFVLTRLKRK